MSFTGFDPAALALLAELPNWSSETYADHKAHLAAGVNRPGLALITAVADRLDAELTVAPRSSVSPLHRDLRFAGPDAPRYKDHLLLTTWEGADKKTSPILWIFVDATRAGFASGMGFTPAVRDRWREAVAGPPGERLADALASLAGEHGFEVDGDEVKRVPKPYDPDHPRADLLRKTGFQARFIDELPSIVDTPQFVDWCSERLERLLPIHRWLIAELT